MDLTLLDHAISTASRAVAFVAATMMLVDRQRQRRDRDRRPRRSRPAP
jgi:hypothetical protein